MSRGVQLTVVEMGDRMVPRMMTPAAGNDDPRSGARARACACTCARASSRSAAPTPRGNALRRDARFRRRARRRSRHRRRRRAPQHRTSSQGSGDRVRDRRVWSTRRCRPTCPASTPPATSPRRSTSPPAAAASTRSSPMRSSRRASRRSTWRAGRVASRGNMALNVLDTLGLISSSFGQWWGVPGGQAAELVDEREFRYLSLQFKDDVLIGATAIGLTEHVGVLRGLIEGRVKLGTLEGPSAAASRCGSSTPTSPASRPRRDRGRVDAGDVEALRVARRSSAARGAAPKPDAARAARRHDDRRGHRGAATCRRRCVTWCSSTATSFPRRNEPRAHS